jgi:hypothetical protein
LLSQAPSPAIQPTQLALDLKLGPPQTREESAMRWKVLPWLSIAACLLFAADSAATCDAPWSSIFVYTSGMAVSEAGVNSQTNWGTQGNASGAKLTDVVGFSPNKSHRFYVHALEAAGVSAPQSRLL